MVWDTMRGELCSGIPGEVRRPEARKRNRRFSHSISHPYDVVPHSLGTTVDNVGGSGDKRQP